MTDTTLLFVNDGAEGLELVVNFGDYSGRDATPAEVHRLAETLLEELESVEIVAEQRYEFDREVEATVHVVRVKPPRPAESRGAELVAKVEAWANECIEERHFLSPP